MPTQHIVYLDESVVHGRDNAPALLLVGALVCPRPLTRPEHSGWQELVAHPHATEREGGLDGPAATALFAGEFGHLTVHLRDVSLGRKKEQAYLDLLVHVLLEANVGPDDELVLHPERFDTSGGERTTGKFEGLVSALRWILPTLPRVVRVESFPSEVHVLVGHSAVDLGLLTISRRLRASRGDLRAALPRSRAVTALHVPEDLDLPDTVTWLRHALGLRPPATELVRLPPTALTAALDARGPDPADAEAWLEQLAPTAENPGGNAASVACLLDALTSTLPKRPALVRRHDYLRARALTHLGRTRDAFAAWNAWDASSEAVAIDRPARVIEEVEGRIALAVMLTDVRDTEGALEALDQAIVLLERHWRLPADPLLARIRGAAAQARLLSGDAEVLGLLAEAGAPYDHPRDLSYGWTWTLVAIGRGAVTPDPAAVVAEVITRACAAERLTLPAIVEKRPFLRWGLAEAVTRVEVAEWPRAVEVARALDAWSPPAGPLRHPDALTARAIVVRRDDVGAWTPWIDGRPPEVAALTAPDATQLAVLRSVAATLGCAGTNSAWLADTQRNVRAALPQVEAVDEFASLARWYRDFLAASPADPAATARFLASGGY